MRTRTLLAGLFVLFALSTPLQAQNASLVKEWIMWPNNALGQSAANVPGPVMDTPATPVLPLRMSGLPIQFFGEIPTQRIESAMDVTKLPTGPFTIELWFVDHVNQPIGGLITARSKTPLQEPAWLLGYYDNRIYMTLKQNEVQEPLVIDHPLQRGWKSYWYHVVAAVDGSQVVLYVNGEQVHDATIEGESMDYPDHLDVELAAYMNHEPYMQLADLFKNVRIYDEALSAETIASRFSTLQEQVNSGILFPGMFHFNAGPYLNYATETSINMVWETDREATAIIEYGLELPLDQSVTIDEAARIQEITIDGLEPQTPYFYRVRAMAGASEIDSGVLTFQTAVQDGTPFAFAVIGDTEARPHINSQLSKQIWRERPNFMLNVGDLTDGGMQHHKFEWNYEYFVGMTQLNSRIPVFPVPGNGEADLHWYNQYHMLPEPEAYYSFRYGNAEFFMLDSNQRREQFAPGGEQYEWLEKGLKESNATWKFVAHHHPTYTMEENDYGNSWEEPTTLGDLDARQILPLYEGLGVDMVFFGHIHGYERTMPIRAGMVDIQNGVIHLLAGGGGGNLEDFAPNRSWFSRKVYRGHHYAMVDIHDQHLSLTMYDTEGRMRDRMDINKDLPPSPNTVSISEHTEYITDEQTIELTTLSDDVTIRYTLDGTTPTSASMAYEEALTVKDPVLLTAASFKDNIRASTVSRARFRRPPAPAFLEKGGLFARQATLAFAASADPDAVIRYTTDGSEPTASSPQYSKPVLLTETTTVTAKAFWPSGLSSETSSRKFVRANYREAEQVAAKTSGLHYAYYQGLWPLLPDFSALTPLDEGIASEIDVFSIRQRDDHFGIVYTGYVDVPSDGIYTFFLASDDGSRLYLGGDVLVDNDGQHGVAEKYGEVALKAGAHPIRIEFFEHGGGESLSLAYEGPGIAKQAVPAAALSHEGGANP